MDDAPALEGEVLDFLEREGALLIPVPEQPSTVRLLPMHERPFFPAQTLSQLMNKGLWLKPSRPHGRTPPVGVSC